MDPKINSKDTELQHEDMPVGFCWGAVIPLWHLFNGTWRVGFLYWFYVYVSGWLVIYASDFLQVLNIVVILSWQAWLGGNGHKLGWSGHKKHRNLSPSDYRRRQGPWAWVGFIVFFVNAFIVAYAAPSLVQ